MLSALPAVIVGGLVFLRRIISFSALAVFGLAFLVYLWSLAAVRPSEFFLARTVALGQFEYSLLVGVIIYLTVINYTADQVVRFTHLILITLIVLISLEIFTPFYHISDAVRSFLYGNSADSITFEVNRDSAIALGLRRPRVFLSETSYVAMTFTAALGASTFLSVSKNSLRRNVIIGMVGLILIRSPIAGIGLLFSVFGYSASPRGRGNVASRAPAIFAAAIVSGTFGLVLFKVLFSSRLNDAVSGVDYSTTYRTYGSVIAAYSVASAYPIFGVGIGSIDAAYVQITHAFIGLGIPSISVDAEWRSQIQNLPSAMLAYLGFGGTLIFIPLFVRYFRLVGGRLRPFFWALFAMLSVTYGSFYSPKFSAFLFFFLGVNAVYNRDVAVVNRAKRSTKRPRFSRRRDSDAKAVNLRPIVVFRGNQ